MELIKMAHGGARSGAGRKAGIRGAWSKAKQEAAKDALVESRKSGETPLEYMLNVMRDQSADSKRRDAMASAAAPYLHPRLSTATLNVKQASSLREMTTDELIAALHAKRDSGRASEAEEGNRKSH